MGNKQISVAILAIALINTVQSIRFVDNAEIIDRSIDNSDAPNGYITFTQKQSGVNSGP